MTANELRNVYLSYYKERRHKNLAASSLVPKDDSSVLYTTAGMQQLIPYFLGRKHPQGNRLVNIQRCLRTGDIEEVGDDYHLTVFEMLGNWSLGDYFKKEAISMSFIFLTEVLGIPKERLAVTVHKGNETVPLDMDTVNTWYKMGLDEKQIFYYGDEENWWGPAGETGPCGPDSEMFYINNVPPCSENCGPACNCGKYVELGNNVFMTYHKGIDGALTELKQKNIDVGFGFERLLILANGLSNVYETDLFLPLISVLESITGQKYNDTTEKSFRIIVEHIRAAVFILSDPANIVPSNSDQGYILRRLIRRMIRKILQLGVTVNILPELARVVIECYKQDYPKVYEREPFIIDELNKEYSKFDKTLSSGLKMADQFLNKLESQGELSGEHAFKLYDTFGFPLELTIELAKEKNKCVDTNGFNKYFKEHQEKSRNGAVGKFKGGLSENSLNSTRLHTATHLLNAGLRHVLGESVYQRGSHINSERLRFDFSFDRKLTNEELDSVEAFVNEAISKCITVEISQMDAYEAKSCGAIGVFDAKYDHQVKVYTIKDYSMEICGGPHANNTSELEHFKILKEQSSSAGVRRIKAVIDGLVKV